MNSSEHQSKGSASLDGIMDGTRTKYDMELEPFRLLGHIHIAYILYKYILGMHFMGFKWNGNCN